MPQKSHGELSEEDTAVFKLTLAQVNMLYLGCRVLILLDLSFISVLKVLDAVCECLAPGGDLVVLIKPQFEALKGQVGRGGVVRDAGVHAEVVDRVSAGIVARASTRGSCCRCSPPRSWRRRRTCARPASAR